MECLEDFVEAIEDLPEQLRDMLTSIRELDLKVQNAVDENTRETEEFFRYAKKMQPLERNSMFQSLISNFRKIDVDAIEKISIVERLEKLVTDRTAMLDREMEKFKKILEKNNPGITTTIEERVAKSSDKEANSTKAQKKKRSTQTRKKSSASLSTVSSVDGVPAVVVEQEEAAALPGPSQSTYDQYDPNEYCFCQQVSYGHMIKCDNLECPYVWFHFACVGLTVTPEEPWYCVVCKP